MAASTLSLKGLKELGERLRDLPERVSVTAKVARRSGLMWDLTWPGARAALSAVAGGVQNPSQVYRVLAANNPSKPGLIWRDRTLTFAEIDRNLDRIAASLAKRGFVRGSSLLIMMRNRPEFVLSQGAAGRLGAAAVSVSWRSTPAELSYLAAHCGARGVVFEAELWPVVEQALRTVPSLGANLFVVGAPSSESAGDGRTAGNTLGRATPFEALLDREATFKMDKAADDDAAVVIYTSGTTGKPKGAVRKFPREAMTAAMSVIAETPMRVDDVHLVACPLYHSTAFGFLGFAHVLGSTAVIMDEFKPEPFLELVERHGVSTTAVVPTMLHRIVQLAPEILARYDTRSLRAVFAAGSPLSGPLASAFMDRFGDILFNFYGATETGLVTLAKPSDLRAAHGTIGRALPGNEVRLLDDTGREVAPGEVGELYVRNKLLVSGYHNDPEATQASMRDGFFSVGDLARVDRSGRYFIEGRKRDMIISGGVNVYPVEVEDALHAHPDVAEAAVVGVEDPDWGERVRAFVVRKPGASLDDAGLKLWARERLAGPKVPREFIFLDALPHNPTGKVLKRELRNWQA